MGRGILSIFLASLCLYGFTNAQQNWRSKPSNWDGPIPSNDIQFDQDPPPYLASGDGNGWTSDDEDYAVSGSGSGSGAGALYPDIEVDPQFLTPRPFPKVNSTTAVPTTTPRFPSDCEREREASKHRLTSYVPKCLQNGDYDALQCEGVPGTGECWCADLNGQRIPGTAFESPDFPNCEEGYNLRPCTYHLVKSTRSRIYGRKRMICTPEGFFERSQCLGSSCFCVDPQSGEKVLGTETHLPDKPNCDPDRQLDATTRRRRPDVKGTGRDQNNVDIDTELEFPKEPSDTIDLDQNGWDGSLRPDAKDGEDDMQNGGDDTFGFDRGLPGDKFLEEEEGEEMDEDEDFKEPDREAEENDQKYDTGSKDSSHGQKDRVEKGSEILTQPGILAGIIGGAVVLLLCLVLLIMFVVYRMRKKDEGSYPLDEPRRGPPNYSYVRAPDKEYYA